jgi:hypothetical protein
MLQAGRRAERTTPPAPGALGWPVDLASGVGQACADTRARGRSVRRDTSITPGRVHFPRSLRKCARIRTTFGKVQLVPYRRTAYFAIAARQHRIPGGSRPGCLPSPSVGPPVRIQGSPVPAGHGLGPSGIPVSERAAHVAQWMSGPALFGACSDRPWDVRSGRAARPPGSRSGQWRSAPPRRRGSPRAKPARCGALGTLHQLKPVRDGRSVRVGQGRATCCQLKCAS